MLIKTKYFRYKKQITKQITCIDNSLSRLRHIIYIVHVDVNDRCFMHYFPWTFGLIINLENYTF